MADTIANDLEARSLAEQAVRALTEQVAESAAEKAAQRAIEGVFLHLGVDIKDPEALKLMREDLGFLQRMSRGAREVKSTAIKTCIGSLIAGLIALLTIGFKDWIWHP